MTISSTVVLTDSRGMIGFAIESDGEEDVK